MLGRITSEINASLNLDTVLERVGEGARALCGSDVVGVALREPDSTAMAFRFWSGVAGATRHAVRVGPEAAIASRVLETRRALRTEHYGLDATGAESDREAIVALMAVPIVLGDRVDGIIYVGNLTARPFTDGDETGVQRLADHAVVAIQNARQFRGHVRRQEELAVLYEIARVLTAEQTDAAMLDALPPLLGRLLDARHLLVLGWDAGTGGFEPLWASSAGWTPGDIALEACVVERGQSIRTIDYLTTCQEVGRAPSPYARGRRYALTVPLRAAGRVVGTLSLWSGERPYSRADEELAATVAALVALRLTRPSAR